jgi:hypothetical protein
MELVPVVRLEQVNWESSGQDCHVATHQQVAMCSGLIIRKVAWNSNLFLFFPKINITKLAGCALNLKKKKKNPAIKSHLWPLFIFSFFYPVLTSV